MTYLVSPRSWQPPNQGCFRAKMVRVAMQKMRKALRHAMIQPSQPASSPDGKSGQAEGRKDMGEDMSVNLTEALLRALLELIEKCSTLEELRESVNRIMNQDK